MQLYHKKCKCALQNANVFTPSEKKYPHQSRLNEGGPVSELQYKLSPTARMKKVNLKCVTRRT